MKTETAKNKKRRVNITLSEETIKIIAFLADKEDIPMTTKAGLLINDALELEEDQILSEIADRRFRESKKEDFISEGDFWKQALSS
ncbi:hypothetical protein K9L63_01590 [Candidatus Gracilibacteria bacterium]|nr:hypothetical protein [Candidatus Gracilibacteria bacterium]